MLDTFEIKYIENEIYKTKLIKLEDVEYISDVSLFYDTSIDNNQPYEKNKEYFEKWFNYVRNYKWKLI